MIIDKSIELLLRGTEEVIKVEELEEKLRYSQKVGEPLRVKLGIDPTAPDVHLGFAVVLRKLRQFQNLGHRAILIVGDFTACIGDPSGRSKTRKMLNFEEVEANARSYLEQFSKILLPEKTEIVFNSQWLGKMNLFGFIELSSKYTIARMLERDDFSQRFNQNKPIGIHEFIYPLLQGYDSIYIQADVELGGRDQKFNMLVGRELQKEYGQSPQVVMMMPILEGLDGVEKMSKSLGNYIGISEPPQQMFGKIMSIPDTLIIRYLTLATELSLTEIKEIENSIKEGTLSPRDAKLRLAKEVVSLYYTKEQAEAAEREFKRVFSKKELPQEIPLLELHTSDLQNGKIWIVELVYLTGVVESKREARRIISQGGVSLDGKKINDIKIDLEVKEGQVLRVGKFHFFKLKLVE